MKRALRITVAVVLATLIAGAALAQMGPGFRGSMGPGEISEPMAKMMATRTQMQAQMTQMQGQMKEMPAMGGMEKRMGGMMGMMIRHQEMMKQSCPGAAGGQFPKRDG